jgi:hypothetical protein
VSSPIHAARCGARRGKSVDIELVPTEASGAHFPFSRFYGLWLVYEAANGIVEHRGGTLWRAGDPAGALGRELSHEDFQDLTDTETPDDQLLRPPSPAERRALQQRKRELVDRFVTSVSYGDVRNWAPLLCEPADGSGRYLDPATSGTPRLREANAALQAIFDRASESKRPQATLRVEVTDPRWIEHLEPGMGWDVYVFDSDAGELI